jgi:hypothetical protein
MMSNFREHWVKCEAEVITHEYAKKLNSLDNFNCGRLMPNLIEIHRVLSKMKHADGQIDPRSMIYL